MTTPFVYTYLDAIPYTSNAQTYGNNIIKTISFKIPNALLGKPGYLTCTQCFIDQQNQVAKPPNALSSNTQTLANGVTYTCIASGPNATSSPYVFFDKVLTNDSWVADNYLGGNNATGAYNGSTMTVDALTPSITSTGAYVELQTTNFSYLESVQIYGTAVNRRPRYVSFYASNNNVDWYFQGSHTCNYSSNLAWIYVSQNSGFYKSYRCVFTANGLPGNNDTVCSVSEINFVTRTVNWGVTPWGFSLSIKQPNHTGSWNSNLDTVGMNSLPLVSNLRNDKSTLICTSGNSTVQRSPCTPAKILIFFQETLDLTLSIFMPMLLHNVQASTSHYRIACQFQFEPLE